MQTTRKQLRGVLIFPTPSTLNIERESLFSVSISHTTKTAYSGQHERRNSSNSSKAIATRCGMLQALSTLRRAKLWGVALLRSNLRPFGFLSFMYCENDKTRKIGDFKRSEPLILERMQWAWVQKVWLWNRRPRHFCCGCVDLTPKRTQCQN